MLRNVAEIGPMLQQLKGGEMDSFFADGETLTPAETKKKFLSFSIGERQKKCLQLMPPNAQKILDLGCYTGLFTKELFDQLPGCEIIGGDYDSNNIKIAKFVYPQLRDIFVEMSAYDIPFDDNHLDVVFFQDVIEHLEGAATSIKEINRVLKPDGCLIIATPSPYYIKELINFVKYEILRKFKKNLPLSSVIFFKDVEWNRHIYCWTPSTLLTLLIVNGFEYVDHAYCQDSSNFLEKIIFKCFPFLSPTMILKVRKSSKAPEKLV